MALKNTETLKATGVHLRLLFEKDCCKGLYFPSTKSTKNKGSFWCVISLKNSENPPFYRSTNEYISLHLPRNRGPQRHLYPFHHITTTLLISKKLESPPLCKQVNYCFVLFISPVRGYKHVFQHRPPSSVSLMYSGLQEAISFENTLP
jgi:hypothetical protein